MNKSTNYILTSRLAEKSGSVSLQKIVRKTSLITLISVVSVLFSVVVAWFIHSGSFASSYTQGLASLCVIAGICVFIFGLIAVCILLWESLVSVHLANLDLKNEKLDIGIDLEMANQFSDFKYAMAQIEGELGSLENDIDQTTCEAMLVKVRKIFRKYLAVESIDGKHA